MLINNTAETFGISVQISPLVTFPSDIKKPARIVVFLAGFPWEVNYSDPLITNAYHSRFKIIPFNFLPSYIAKKLSANLNDYNGA